jgi:hypothetical protein
MRTQFNSRQPTASAGPKIGPGKWVEVGISWIISILLLAIITALIVALIRG